MATKAKAALVSERYSHDMEKPSIYTELRHQLELVKPEEARGEWSQLRLDLANNAIALETPGDAEPLVKRYNLSAHAEAQLCERIGMGRAHEILSSELYASVEREYQTHANRRPGGFTVKHRGGLALALLTDEFKEIPYGASIGVLEDLGARPIRLTLNDTLVKVQAIFDPRDFEPIEPADGEAVSVGIQMRSSDVGASSLHFEVFTYRWICSNGMIFGKNGVFKFRTVHLRDRSGTAAEADKEIKRVLNFARDEIAKRTNILIKAKMDETRRTQIINFLGKRGDIGKRAAESLLLPIVRAVNVYDVVNALTAAGHDSQYKPSLQNAFEQAAGDLMLLASA